MIKPLYDRIAVQHNKPKLTTVGGIHLIESIVDSSYEGLVVAVGIGKLLEDGTIRPMSINVGDKILFDKLSNRIEIVIDNKKIVILHEEDIIGILN